ncbi:MAG: DUF1674 domain-containing protein [Steroidobacteraceae bacterium]|jgi:hypothetical protein
MQNDPQGVGRPASAAVAVPSSNVPVSSEQTVPGVLPAAERPREFGGPEGPEPTRYGDWEKKGRCVDF